MGHKERAAAQADVHAQVKDALGGVGLGEMGHRLLHAQRGQAGAQGVLCAAEEDEHGVAAEL